MMHVFFSFTNNVHEKKSDFRTPIHRLTKSLLTLQDRETMPFNYKLIRGRYFEMYRRKHLNLQVRWRNNLRRNTKVFSSMIKFWFFTAEIIYWWTDNNQSIFGGAGPEVFGNLFFSFFRDVDWSQLWKRGVILKLTKPFILSYFHCL